MNKQKALRVLVKNSSNKLLHFLFSRYANDGYIHEELKETDYMLGASPLIKTVIRPDGDWTNFLPQTETQHSNNNNFDSMACVSFSFLNCLEMLARVKYGETWNLSDRFLAKMSGTSRGGNTFSAVGDTARKSGLLNEDKYPWNRETETWQSFFTEIQTFLKEEALGFLDKYEIGYEAVPSNYTSLREALKFSPLWVAGYAWYEKNGVYYNYGNPNHAFTLVKIDETRKEKLAFDTYEPFLKKLSWDFNFAASKIVVLNKKNTSGYDTRKIAELAKKGLEYIMRSDTLNGGNGQVYKLEKDKLRELTQQEIFNFGITSLSGTKKLTGITEVMYKDLCNIE